MLEGEETENNHEKQAALDDIGCNADLYISSQMVVQDLSFRLIFGRFARLAIMIALGSIMMRWVYS